MRPLAAIALAATLSACVEPARDNELPDRSGFANAVLEGYPAQIRSWGDGLNGGDTGFAGRLGPQLDRDDTRLDILALSSGGADGAFGAGVLRGWSEAGTRPVFDIVTGVSTGAIIAPFAFLGSEGDAALERFYTATSTLDLVQPTPLLALRGGPAVADTRPLAQIVASVIDEALLERIAAEHRAGRRLLIASTNLDAERPVYWDIGEIAASDNPGAAALVRRIILASSAIPGAFPPVEFAVSVDGAPAGELHVDGGVTREVFALPFGTSIAAIEAARGAPFAERNIWVVVNNKIDPEFAPVRPRIVDIGQRSLETLIRAQTESDLLRIEGRGRQDGAVTRFIAVPAQIRTRSNQPFDRIAMGRLFDAGRMLGQSPDAWREADGVLRLTGGLQ